MPNSQCQTWGRRSADGPLKSYHIQACKNRHQLDLHTAGRYKAKMRLHDFKKIRPLKKKDVLSLPMIFTYSPPFAHDVFLWLALQRTCPLVRRQRRQQREETSVQRLRTLGFVHRFSIAFPIWFSISAAMISHYFASLQKTPSGATVHCVSEHADSLRNSWPSLAKCP